MDLLGSILSSMDAPPKTDNKKAKGALEGMRVLLFFCCNSTRHNLESFSGAILNSSFLSSLFFNPLLKFTGYLPWERLPSGIPGVFQDNSAGVLGYVRLYVVQFFNVFGRYAGEYGQRLQHFEWKLSVFSEEKEKMMKKQAAEKKKKAEFRAKVGEL